MSSIFNSAPIIDDDDIVFLDFEDDYVHVDNDPLNTAFYGVEDMKEKFGSDVVNDDEENLEDDNYNFLDIAFSDDEDFEEKFGLKFDMVVKHIKT